VPVQVPPRRTGPAIIRRQTPPSVPVAPPKPVDTSFDSPFAESTKVTSYDELEARAQETRGPDRSKVPTAPPPLSFSPHMDDEDDLALSYEEDYADIEIGANDEPQTPAAPAPRRTVAHVVRRETRPTAQPVTRRESDPVIEVERAPSAPAGEDDFSDVAAAVGAGDEGRLSEPMIPARRPMTPPHEIVIDDRDAAIEEDAYVPMAPAIEPDLPPDLPGIDDDPETSVAIAAAPDPGTGRPPALTDLYPRVKTPTSVPPLGGFPASQPRAPAPRLQTAPIGEVVEIEPAIDLDAVGVDSTWPEQLQPLATSQLDEDSAQWLLVFERELATVDEPSEAAQLRVEAGRLCERLGEIDRARAHYDAALLADPRATAALRGLRRIARSQSDLVEATRQLDAEIAVAGALERRPLGHYRVDLLLASGEQDLARVAAGEILDSAPSDVRALLAQLELAFLDGRAEELRYALERLAHAVTDNELRAAVQSARAVLAAHHDDGAAAATWFAAAAESDPASLGARLGAIRQAAGQGNGDAAARAMLDLARAISEADAFTAAALALRAQFWAKGETATAAAQLASSALPGEPLVVRAAAESAIRANDPVAAATALSAWAASEAPPHERAYAAGRAAELDPARGAELWSLALAHDPGDDYAAAQLRTAHVAADQTQRAIDVDMAMAADIERDRARLRAAFGLIAESQLDAAIALLASARGERKSSLAIAEALAEALAAAGRWADRAKLLAELAEEPPEQLDREIAQLRSALAWEEAVGAAAAHDAPDPDEIQRATTAALGAWDKVLEAQPGSPTAHAATLVLAGRLGDRDILADALARAQQAAQSPWAAASLALRRARLDASEAADVLRDAPMGIDDPRRSVLLELAAARKGELSEAVAALEERARVLGDGQEAATLRLRAAQIALDTGDAPRATSLLRQVESALPMLGIVPDLLAAARRRAGDRTPAFGVVTASARTGAASRDAFAHVVRDGDAAAAAGDGAAAVSLYQRALEMRPGDPLAALPLIRVATQIREPGPVAALALAQLRAAEASGDGVAKAEAYELLARIDKELRNDAGSAQVALESASQADPSRVDLMHRLEREYAVTDQLVELIRLRRAELDQIPTELANDRAAMIMDIATLCARDGRTDDELSELYRRALEADPRRRMALLHLESIVRRSGASVELAKLEEQIAAYFEGEPRTQAAFYTRAGETLAEVGNIDGAVGTFGKASEVLPGHVPALEGWRAAALKGQLWIDVAEAANRQAAVTDEPEARAKLYHFAGVALMDKALAGEQAMIAFRKALEADPTHRDSFLRLRILLEEDANHDELAIVLGNRLEHEQDPKSKIEIHRALAELFRNFLSDRDNAKQHYREILAADPNDLRAHSAVADIAWEQGAWQEAADALMARARLERDPQILKTLLYRLGLIYADRLVDVPLALKAFQRALTYSPDDENTLVRLADLATQAQEWKLALGACERLVKSEQDADKRASHLHRVARIFKQGFGDMKRAERALNLALDGAPTNDDALSQLVQFYRDAGDMVSVRVHLNRVAGTMRTRVQPGGGDPKDGVAYRVISRAMAARAAAGVDGSIPIARAAAELANLLGAADGPERLLLADPPRVDLAPLLRAETDEVLFPRTVQVELRQMFTLLGDRVAKHVGIDLKPYGVSRGDRLRAKDSPVAAHAQDVATGLGFGEIDVYVSARQPYAMVAEPTSPVSLVIGQAIANMDSRAIRFAAGAALKLAQASLAIPARLASDELGVLVVSLLRLFQPEFPTEGLDGDAVAAQTQKLRRLIPTGLSNELRPFALAVDSGHFRHENLARDLRIAGLRAGLVASGSLVAGLTILAAAESTDVPGFLANPVAQGLITWALSEDHASVTR
jgi:tetratricopeptide (TPR) repeat protein